MAAEASFKQIAEFIDYTPTAAITAGEVIQLADGRAAVAPRDIAANEKGAVQVRGVFKSVVKTTSVVMLDGQEVYWDHSANAAHFKTSNDRDFFVGSAVGDAAAADTEMSVNLNVRPTYLIDMQRDAVDTAIVKTVVGSTTVEVPDLKMRGGSAYMIFGATAEAQKVDMLSKAGFAVQSKWIFEAVVNVVDDGDAAAIDFNIGVANDTHASDADAIAESCFFHLDGNSLDLFAESDDGTTEVAATDTTVNIALGTPVHLMIDGRNPADIQLYVDGVNVLPSSVFVLTAATGPLKLLAHLEKTSDDTVADYRVNVMRVRIAQQ
jgi:predicted RecA/RadA family phage recombinase